MIKKNDMKYNKSKLFIVALSLLLGIIACTKVSNTYLPKWECTGIDRFNYYYCPCAI